jgi:hydroxymethylglutaryl-CoA synthase
MAGIHAYAVQLPRLTVAAQEYATMWGRCAARIEAKRVPDHDEDAFTLALAAAREVLPKGPAPSVLLTASSQEPGFGALLADALGMGGARLGEHRGPTAALQALQEANDAVAAGHGAALVVASDAPAFAPDDEAEHGAGAGAIALLLTAKGPVQLRRAAHGAAPGLPGLDRSDAALAQAFAALTRSGLAADSIAKVAGNDLDGTLGKVAAKAFPKAKVNPALARIGDAGAASPLLALARALEEVPPGEALVLAAHGEGQAIALALEAEAAPHAATLAQALAAPTEALDYARMARLRGFLASGGSTVSQGAAVSPAQFLDQQPARLRLEAQRCAACDKVQFPPREGCLECGGITFKPQRLSGKGEVYSVSTIGRGSAPAEFAEQQRRAGAYDVALVSLEEGPRVAAQVCDAAPGHVRVGDPVRLVVRRLYVQDGAVRYGFKARPT